MTKYDAKPQESFGNHTIDARDVRALTEVMSVLDDIEPGEDIYTVVSGSGKQYTVDVRSGSCTCPDFEHNLPVEREDGTTRYTCKHVARVTYEISARPIPGWVDTDALDDQIGIHIDATPVVARSRSGVATDGGRVETDVDVEDRDVEDGEPCEDCQELGALDDDSVLSCFACYLDGGRR